MTRKSIGGRNSAISKYFVEGKFGEFKLTRKSIGVATISQGRNSAKSDDIYFVENNFSVCEGKFGDQFQLTRKCVKTVDI